MAEHDGKIVFDLEVDTSSVKGDIQKALNSVKGQTAKITVTADTSAATTQLNRVSSAARDVNSTNPTVNVNADTTTANNRLDHTRGVANALDATDPSVDVSADTTTANNRLDDTHSRANALENSDPTVDVDAETSSANALLDATQSRANALENTNPTVDVSADVSAATSELDFIRSQAQDVEASDPQIDVTADVSSATSELSALQGEINNTQSLWDQLKDSMTSGVGGNLVSGAADLLKSGLSGIFSTGMSFEYGQAKARTLMPETADVQAYSDALISLAQETGQSMETLWEGTYNSLSASMDFGNSSGDSMINFLRIASQVGTSGFTDVNTAAAAMAKVNNVYGGQYTPDQIAQMMLRTQNRGITDVGQLSSNLPRITGAAAPAGVGFDQVSAMMSTVTAQGIATPEAGTKIVAMLNELVKTDTTGNKAMQESLKGTEYQGKTLKEIMESGGDIGEVLGHMQTYAERKGLNWVDMFSSSEAASAATFLTNNGGEMWRSNLAYMRSDEDTLGAAYGIMGDTTTVQAAKLQAQWAEVQVKLFTALSPIINKVMDVLAGEKMQAALDRIVDSLTTFIESGGVETVLNGLVAGIEWLLDVISGKRDIFEEFGNGLRKMFHGIINELIDWVNSSFGLSLEHIGEGGEGGKGGEGNGEGKGKSKIEHEPTNNGMLTSLANVFPNSIFSPVDKGVSWIKGQFSPLFGIDSYTVSGGAKPREVTTSGPGRYGGATREGGVDRVAGFTKGGGSGRDKKATTEVEPVVKTLTSAVESTANAAEQTTTAQESVTSALESAASAAESSASAASGTASAATSVGTNLRKAATKASVASSAASSLSSGISSLQSAITSLARKVNSYTVPTGGGGTATPETHAVGLDYVPYDGYGAILHKGEMVLTAAEASAFRFGGHSSGSGFDASALAAAMQGVEVTMDGRMVGRLVERSVSTAQSVRYARSARKG